MALKKTGYFVATVAKKALMGGAVGGGAGYLAGGFVAPSEHKDSAAKDGVVVGAAAGAAGTVAGALAASGMRKLLRQSYGGLLKVSRAVGKKPQFDEGKIVKAAAGGARYGRYVFRRVRGRIIRIAVK